VVDDEHVTATTLAAILNFMQFRNILHLSTRGHDRCQVQSAGLLISDVLMPGLPGVDLAIQIKVECPECKILLFSGHATTQYLLKDARSKWHNFQLLQKPVQPSVTFASIEALRVESSLGCLKKSPGSVTPRILQMPTVPRAFSNDGRRCVAPVLIVFAPISPELHSRFAQTARTRLSKTLRLFGATLGRHLRKRAWRHRIALTGLALEGAIFVGLSWRMEPLT
jgi:DNA-binding response OmpR family regulator